MFDVKRNLGSFWCSYYLNYEDTGGYYFVSFLTEYQFP